MGFQVKGLAVKSFSMDGFSGAFADDAPEKEGLGRRGELLQILLANGSGPVKLASVGKLPCPPQVRHRKPLPTVPFGDVGW